MHAWRNVAHAAGGSIRPAAGRKGAATMRNAL
jgi:hypothetical protein